MRSIDLVGPKGYEHGWKFVGVPGVTSHSDLLRMRTEARAALPQGHPERLKAERAVRQSRKLGTTHKAAIGDRGPRKSTRAERLLNAEFTPTEQAVYAPVTPGESGTGLSSSVAKKSAPGVHPSQLTVSSGTAMTGYHYPSSAERRRGAQAIPFPEIRSSVRNGDKVLGSYGTREHQPYGGRPAAHTAEFNSGNKSTYLGSAPEGMTHQQAHAHFGEVVKQQAAADANTRQVRAALSAAGHSAVKSHSTSVRGWHNIDPGAQVSATPNGVHVDYYGGSSLVGRSKDPQYQAAKVEAMAKVLESKGWTVDRVMQDGRLVSLNIPNAMQGVAPTPQPESRSERHLAEVDARTREGQARMTSNEQGTLNYYGSAIGFKNINDRARGLSEPRMVFGKDQQAESIKAMDSAFKKTPPLQRAIEVHRGITDAGARFGPDGSAVGKAFRDKGYVSTSTDPSVAQRAAEGHMGLGGTAPTDAAMLHISVPAGEKALSPDLFSTRPRTANEVLLPRGTSLRVIRDRREGGMRHIYAIATTTGGSQATGTTTTSLSTKLKRRKIDLVGPHGYEHGWKYVGVERKPVTLDTVRAHLENGHNFGPSRFNDQTNEQLMSYHDSIHRRLGQLPGGPLTHHHVVKGGGADTPYGRMRAARDAQAELLSTPFSKTEQATMGLRGPKRNARGKVMLSRVDLVGPKGYEHGWIKVDQPGAASLHGKEVIGLGRMAQEHRGIYDHRNHTVTVPGRGRIPVHTISLPGKTKKFRKEKTPSEFSAETPALVATPAPIGKPGGPGLYGLKGAKLPNYIENIRNALMRGGMSEGRATATAISRCKLWAAGGGGVHPEVKAAAAAAIAELKATAARAKAVHGHSGQHKDVIELFNPYHAPVGPGGGRFTSKSGGSGGGASPSKAQQGRTPSGTNPRAQKAAIMRQVGILRKRIATQVVTLNGFKAQRTSLTLSVGGSKAKGTTVARKAKKTATKKSKTTVKKKAGAKAKATSKTTGSAATKAANMATIASLTNRINSLSSTIRSERAQVRSLTAKARSL